MEAYLAMGDVDVETALAACIDGATVIQKRW